MGEGGTWGPSGGSEGLEGLVGAQERVEWVRGGGEERRGWKRSRSSSRDWMRTSWSWMCSRPSSTERRHRMTALAAKPIAVRMAARSTARIVDHSVNVEFVTVWRRAIIRPTLP